MILKDAHNHLHYSEFKNQEHSLVSQCLSLGVQQCVVNATCEDDWLEVLALHQRHQEFIIPAIGIHPWKVNQVTPHWKDRFLTLIANNPQVVIGEVGLDNWIKNANLPEQEKIFSTFLHIACEKNLPISIHCLKAWGSLLKILKQTKLPERGIHIHGFGGSREVFQQLKRYNPYYSFSSYFLHQKKTHIAEIYKNIPLDRILIETDAPDLIPPQRWKHKKDSNMNHPTNLTLTLSGLAGILGSSTAHLATITTKNFDRYFKT